MQRKFLNLTVVLPAPLCIMLGFINKRKQLGVQKPAALCPLPESPESPAVSALSSLTNAHVTVALSLVVGDFFFSSFEGQGL